MAPALVLRDALKILVLASTPVTATVGARVLDRVPSPPKDADFPFVGFGPMRQERLEAGCGPATPVKIRLYAASRDYERDGAWILAEAVADAIEGQQPALAAPFALAGELLVTMVGDALENGQPRTVFVDVTGLVYRAG